MKLTIEHNTEKQNLVILSTKTSEIESLGFSEVEKQYIKKQVEKDAKHIFINQYSRLVFIEFIETDVELNEQKEKARRNAGTVYSSLKSNKVESVSIINSLNNKEISLAFAEGLLFSDYKFDKYVKKSEETYNLQEIKFADKDITPKDVEKMQIIFEGITIVRDMVNEPYNALNSLELAEKAEKISESVGLNVEVLSQKQIEALKMGGLLAVNKASTIPPTFSIIEWKPQNAANKKPIILVGKGIVYDTGGYNLKPGNFMEDMKQDMAGAATVIGVMYIIAKLKMPVYIIGLVPSTDNVVSSTGIVSGDIIRMYDGTTVEVINTDAEGRLILADALSYAKKYDPQLVIDMATLTGAASRAVDVFASAVMCKIDEQIHKLLFDASFDTYERLVEFPLWDDYKDSIKSKIADIKNIGSSNAGQITAAKFLEHFTSYPWIHLDIAPTAYYEKGYKYRGEGASGIPVKLLINFIEKLQYLWNSI